MIKILRRNQATEPVENEVIVENVELADDEKIDVSPEEDESSNENSAGEKEDEEEDKDSGESKEEKKPADPFMNEALAFAKGRGLSEEAVADAMAFMDKVKKAEVRDLPMLEVVLNGLDYKRAVDAAFADGELQGRNRQIEEKYMRPLESDGLPHPGIYGAAPKNTRRATSIFDLARRA